MASSEENERERLHAFDFDGVFDSRSDNGHLWRQVGVHALGLFLNGTDGEGATSAKAKAPQRSASNASGRVLSHD